MKLVNNLYFYPEQGMLDSNTYVFTGNPGVVCDPGNPDFLPDLLEAMARDGVDPREIGYIVNTHLHLDHSAGNTAFKEASGARIALHPVQKRYYQDVVINGARMFGMTPSEFTEDVLLEDRLEAGGASWELIPATHRSASVTTTAPAGSLSAVTSSSR